MDLNWGAWLQGLIVALATGGATALGLIATFDSPPKGWQFFVVAGIPTIMSFLGYIKQTPPPIGK